MSVFADVDCRRCGGAWDEWPELPVITRAELALWVSEHGCPLCGCLEVVVDPPADWAGWNEAWAEDE